jgi:hypothetical protein
MAAASWQRDRGSVSPRGTEVFLISCCLAFYSENQGLAVDLLLTEGGIACIFYVNTI